MNEQGSTTALSHYIAVNSESISAEADAPNIHD